MAKPTKQLTDATKIFVRGFCAVQSLTHPYECERVGSLWRMRDAPRRNPRDYRKEEWVACGPPPEKVDAAARAATRGRFFVSVICGNNEPNVELAAEYKRLGYRLQGTEPLFVHRLMRIKGARAPVKVCRVKTTALAEQLGKATRSKPLTPALMADDAPFRQYAALEGTKLVGWVRSVAAQDSRWCSHMFVLASHRRRGIGTAMLAKMLRDDRAAGARQSLLLSSHAGARLYPRVGYEQIGLLSIFEPKKK